MIRQSDVNWAGLAIDMITEQCLMISIKNNGGLKNGSDMTEIQRMMFLLLMPVSYQYNQAMKGFTNVLYKSSTVSFDIFVLITMSTLLSPLVKFAKCISYRLFSPSVTLEHNSFVIFRFLSTMASASEK